MNGNSLENLVSLAKRRGFVFPSSDIYGGIAGFYDYGPYGAQLAKNIRDLWWRDFVVKRRDMVGLDSSIIQNPKLWEASGHVGGFNDPMVDCKNCQNRFRADHLAETDITDPKQLSEMLQDKACPSCGKKGMFTEVRQFNMMFKTYVGASEESDAVAYLRPETAGGIFANFDLVRETTRAKLPFGVAQIGKAFRNEISPREFLFRVREFEQMEIEYFVYPDQAEKQLAEWKEQAWQWLLSVGLDESKLEWHQHGEDERAHYAADSWDINYAYPFGSKELWGVANRTDYDLSAHQDASGKRLTYFDEASGEHIIPYVIEPSIGLSRLFLAVMDSAYNEEQLDDNETRTVLKLDKKLAPVKVAVLPLSKKENLSELAHSVYDRLVEGTDLVVEYDESQSIGKRYRRQDEIGTPLCVTVDFDSLEDDAVTVRDRDTMEQVRVKIEELNKIIKERINE